MWKRTSGGLALTFHLAGINNQNFLMRDNQTGSYWQQITGAAVSGPLAGRRLELVSSDELSFGLWSAEEPGGTVLENVTKYAAKYEKKDWEVEMQKEPTVLSFADPARKLEPRTLMLGIRAFGASRAYPYDEVLKEKLVLDHVGSEAVLLVVGPDGQSVRAFRDRTPALADANGAARANGGSGGGDNAPAFYRTLDDSQSRPKDPAWLKEAAVAPIMMDEATASAWNFQGCAISGKSTGACLDPVEVMKDYWFDWRNYNPATTVYVRPAETPAKAGATTGSHANGGPPTGPQASEDPVIPSMRAGIHSSVKDSTPARRRTAAEPPWRRRLRPPEPSAPHAFC